MGLLHLFQEIEAWMEKHDGEIDMMGDSEEGEIDLKGNSDEDPVVEDATSEEFNNFLEKRVDAVEKNLHLHLKE